MTKFEEYLTENGFVASNNDVYSSIDNIKKTYTKGDIIIVFGLNMFNSPPTLIHPRPIIKIIAYSTKTKHKMSITLLNYEDSYMNAILDKYSPEIVFNNLNKLSFVFNDSPIPELI